MRYIIVFLLFCNLYAQFLPKPKLQKTAYVSNLDIEEDYYLKSYEEKEFALKSFKNTKKAVINLFSKNKGNFLYYQNKSKTQKFKLNVFMGTDYTKNDDFYRLFVSNGFIVNGKYKNLSFNARWWAGFFKGDYDYTLKSPLIKGFKKTKETSDKDNVYYDEISASMKYTSSYGDFSLNRGTLDVSNHIGSSIFLNTELTNYSYFLWQLKFANSLISFATASLISDSLDANYPYKRYDEKYLALHEFRYNPDGLFSFFIGEQIVYGSRSIDLAYTLPATFWRVTEHKLMDRDNVMFYGGINYNFYPYGLFYANFLLDELRKNEILGNWWGNKYAIQAGISYQKLPAISKSTHLTLQFTAVRPWLYTHYITPVKYTNNGYCLGHEKGANLIEYSAKIKSYFNNRLWFESLCTYTRQGSLGSDYLQNYDTRPKDTANWLEGKIKNTFESKNIVTYKVNRHHRLKFGYIYNDKTKSEFSLSYMVIY